MSQNRYIMFFYMYLSYYVQYRYMNLDFDMSVKQSKHCRSQLVVLLIALPQ